MLRNKIEIDLDKLEAEISGFDKIIDNATKVIEDATKERSLKLQLINYIVSNYSTARPKGKSDGLSSVQNNVDFGRSGTPVGKVGQPTGISDFVRAYVKSNSNVHTSAICKAYANEINVPLDSNLKRVVSRCLTRLKNAGEINNELKEGGKRAGSTWVYNK